MPKPTSALWTPNGLKTVGKPLERVELRPGLTEWFRQFVEVAAHFSLGLHCSKCGADIVGRNADSDRSFSVACGCREFIGMNRDYQPEQRH